MSRRHSVQSADGVIVDIAPTKAVQVVKAAAPSNTTNAVGFAPGCTWHNTAGTAGSVFYVNTGTATVAVWLNIASWLIAFGLACVPNLLA